MDPEVQAAIWRQPELDAIAQEEEAIRQEEEVIKNKRQRILDVMFLIAQDLQVICVQQMTWSGAIRPQPRIVCIIIHMRITMLPFISTE
jgi:hypothetical protein